jgi:uncharacterized protein (DUF2236 family)
MRVVCKPSGLFSPTSTFWRVNREALMVLSGPRALLLELAHPLVAAGVAEHSDFRGDPLGRLFRTIGVMTALNFEEAGAARAAARHTQRCHRPVRGVLTEDVGPYLSGTPYTADDPLLRLWVLATLIDSVLQTYDCLIAPLSPADKRAYYADGQRLGQALGLPPEMMPPTYEDFETYMDSMLNSDQLTVGPDARAIVRALFAHPSVGGLTRLMSFVSLGLLPERLRTAYGFGWGERHERWLQRFSALTRRVRPLVPGALCAHPQATRAEWSRNHRRTQTAKRADG